MAIHHEGNLMGTKPGLQADWYFIFIPPKVLEMNRL